MMKFLSFVPLASLLLFGITDAFTINPMASSAMKQKTSALQVSTETFYRALECAEGHSCDVSELDKLASELEQFVGCTYEEDSSKEVCEKEIQDRMDLAEILRLKVELKLRYVIRINLTFFISLLSSLLLRLLVKFS